MPWKNVGDLDRTLRLAGGAALVLAGLLLLQAGAGLGPALVLTVLGTLGLFTGATRVCVLYRLLRISTMRPANQRSVESPRTGS